MADRDTIDAQPFRLATRIEPGRTRLEVHGELDLATVDALEQAVRDLRAQGCGALVLDLRPLVFIDSSGLQLLLRLDAQARAEGVGFAIVEGDGPVRRLLAMTDLTGDFEHAEP